MNQESLLNNERIITQSDRKIITLTNLRLRYSDSEWDRAHIISILLENISSIEIHYRSKTIFAILALLAIVGGLIAGANGDQEFVGIGIGAGVVLIILYLVSRRHFLTISSNGGGKVNFHTKGMKREKVLEFVNQLESSIKQRREELK